MRAQQHAARLGVVADDLTGANATGVRLSAMGLEVWSALEAAHVPPMEGPAQAVMRVTESRAVPAGEAARRVAQATEELVAGGATTFGKRIDSTIRGNLGAELEAMLAALDAAGRPHLALVVPAYPASGRVVAGGYLLVHGVPVEETAAGSDPGAPVRESRVEAVLREQTNLPMERLELHQVLQGPEGVEAALQDALRRGSRVVVADATTDGHVDALALGALRLESPVLSVDPGPFTGALTRARLAAAGWPGPSPRPRGKHGRAERAAGEAGGAPLRKLHLAGAVGSVTPLSHRQVERAAGEGIVEPILLPVDALLPSGRSPRRPESLREAAREALQAALEALHRGQVPLFVTAPPGGRLLPPEAAGGVADGVGRVVALLAEEAAGRGMPLDGLYLSGGDITVAACRALASPVLRLEDEVEPLVAFARLAAGPRRGLALVTKGGLVGDDEALIRCLRYLETHAAERPLRSGPPLQSGWPTVRFRWV